MSATRAISDEERRVWVLLTRDFHWEIPPDYPVRVYGADQLKPGPTRLQVFEIAVARIMSCLQPDYDWEVSRDGRDGGLDFVGRHLFLDDSELGIEAKITVGGQCKMRTLVPDVVDVVGTSLMRMADTLNPTFFVVALSARVSQGRIDDARRILEQIHHRHCHILDRPQVEGLISEHLGVVEEILRKALDPTEVEEVLRYFRHGRPAHHVSLVCTAPDRVLAGTPFTVEINVRSPLVSSSGARIWWSPTGDAAASARVALIGPVGAETSAGTTLNGASGSDDPLLVRQSLELITYAVGDVDLGEVVVGRSIDGVATALEQVHLGRVHVIDNVRPRFFERPMRSNLTRLQRAFKRSSGGVVTAVGVTGAGGGGKSRMCEEFALERRRRGCSVVSVKQAKSHDDPARLFADLLLALARPNVDAADDAAQGVTKVLRSFDQNLARKIAPTIRASFGSSWSSGPTNASMVEQDLLAALVVLVVARARRTPLIIHLQDLHWCMTDVLRVLERMLLCLQDVIASDAPTESRGVLLVFEGRVRESGESGDDVWTSGPFEAFLDRVDADRVHCVPFTPRDALDFVGRLFEDRHSAQRVLTDDLLGVQRDVIQRIDRIAGGNPFHTMAQVQLLTDRGVLGRNRDTGLHYLISPEPDGLSMPESVLDAIRRRWQYLHIHHPHLALLVWACSLLEDRIPDGLFRRLQHDLAPGVMRHDVDATDVLWTGSETHSDVLFRHENYFSAMRALDVAPADRDRAVHTYADWFRSLGKLSPADQFRLARVLLEAPEPNVADVRRLLRSSLRGSRRQGDDALRRRITTVSLDLAWAQEARNPLAIAGFIAHCDEEITLLYELLDSDRQLVEQRLTGLRERLHARLSRTGRTATKSTVNLERRRLAAEVLYAHFLFNEQHAERAVTIASDAVRDLRHVAPSTGDDPEAWEILEMEALHTQAIAVAIAGDPVAAEPISARSLEIARRYPSNRARHVIGTHGNILMGIDAEAGVALLRECLTASPAQPEVGDADRVEIHLSLGLVVLAHRCELGETNRRRELLAEARQRLTRVMNACFRLGLYPDASAATLLLGIVDLLEGGGDAVACFAQAVAAAARGQQSETLWKAHINLALALHRDETTVGQNVRDHALAALEIIERSLASYASPDASARFAVVRTPMVRAVGLLVQAGDDAGLAALERYPSLRQSFVDAEAGLPRNDVLTELPGHATTLRIGGADYVLY